MASQYGFGPDIVNAMTPELIEMYLPEGDEALLTYSSMGEAMDACERMKRSDAS